MGAPLKTQRKTIEAMNMGLKEDIAQKFAEFKSEQKRRSEFKKELDFKKFQALEIERAKREVKEAREGKKSQSPFSEFELDPRRITLYDEKEKFI